MSLVVRFYIKTNKSLKISRNQLKKRANDWLKQRFGKDENVDKYYWLFLHNFTQCQWESRRFKGEAVVGGTALSPDHSGGITFCLYDGDRPTVVENRP